MTRRDFVRRVGRYGSAAATGAMLALDLLARPDRGQSARTDPGSAPPATQPDGKRPRVLILGAGLCGMSAAYELGKLGYDCEIFEARARSGGRCWTVRGGTRQTEVGGPEQTAGFAGRVLHESRPGAHPRPPHHHAGLLPGTGRAHRGVQQRQRERLLSGQGSAAVRMREARADLRGYVDELLAKAVSRDALDRPLTADDKEALIEYLREDARPLPDLVYKPSSATGPTSTAPRKAGATSTTTCPPPARTRAG